MNSSELKGSHLGLLGPKVTHYSVIFPANCGYKPSLACLDVGLSGFHFRGNDNLNNGNMLTKKNDSLTLDIHCFYS